MEHTPETTAHEDIQQIRYAGFWRRFLAYILDALILCVVTFLVLGMKGFFMPFVPLAIGWLYYALMESSKYQATLGKIALSMKVTDEDGKTISFGRATGRHFAKIVSGLILGIGYLMVIWTKKKQGLHDKMAHTLVVRTQERFL